MADSHLGHRRYYRMTKAGLNQREADVARTFVRTIDRIIELRPDIIVHAGDVFDLAHPPNAAVVHAFAQFRRLRTALPDTPVVLVAGNHDRGRTSDTGCILALFRQIGCHVAIAAPQRFTFGDISVLAVPELPDHRGLPELTPDDARYRVLLLHGEITGVIKSGQQSPVQQISVEALKAPAWTYIALGHYHVMHEVAPNACYSGSLELTASGAWTELKEMTARGVEKGFIEVDLETGVRTFHPVPLSRRFIDLEMDGAGMTPPDLNAAIASSLDAVEGRIDDAVVRLVVHDCERAARKEVDPAMVRRYRLRALNLQLELRPPEAGIVIGGSQVTRPMSNVDRLRGELAARADWSGQTVAQLMDDLGITPADADDWSRADAILAGLDGGLKPGDEPLDTGVPTVPDYTAEYERIVATHRLPEPCEETNAAA